jgi:hypothetical protein
MARKRWTPQLDVTPSLLKFREKRKWQINLRRYVIEKNPCPSYAPYFGLDIENLRQWFEMQFESDITWGDFGKKWHFDHIIPVTYFDFAEEAELRMCWNFTNLRVAQFKRNKDWVNSFDALAAKGYFGNLYKKTLYLPCLKLLEKIERIELSAVISTDSQQAFIKEYKTYLDMIEGYSGFEFELLNKGRSIDEVKKEVAFLKKHEK